MSEGCSCRHCLAQISKGRRPESNIPNIYCPRLLFSKDEIKISIALSDLFAHPSNQFRLFVDSVKIHSDALKYIIRYYFRLCCLILFSEYSDDFVPILTKIIAIDSCFQKFIELQLRLLEGISLEDIEFCVMDKEIYKSDIQELVRNERPIDNFDDIPSYLRILAAMSIRDSSFIISFSEHATEPSWKSLNHNNCIYFYKIDLIDLDIKPIEKLEKYISEIKIHG